jgi:uncharacterized phage protein (TIGR01671 family)
MREIKFRGHNFNMKWVYGYYYGYNQIKTMSGGIAIVDPKSIGQYTGLKDCNDKEIFEGDIIEIEQGSNQKSFRGLVVYDDYMFDIEDFYLPYYDYPTIAFSEGTQSMEVIGNIYNNPDLLKGE